MLVKIGWSLWAIAPAIAIALHFGPGQKWMKRDLASDRMLVAQQEEASANRLQAAAYQTQFDTIKAREQLLREDNEANRKLLEEATSKEHQAYAAASDAWKNVADRYQEVESLLDGTPQAKQVRWLRGRSLVRSGEVFNGIEALQQTLMEATEGENPDGKLATAAREELAAANYYGARLLREEGRSSEVWKQVSETSRQQFRYLAERTSKEQDAELATNLQKNLERVLDLEQLDRSELIGRPIPKDSPRGRRPGDGEPSKQKGIGPRPDGDQPGNGASGMLEIGPGW